MAKLGFKLVLNQGQDGGLGARFCEQNFLSSFLEPVRQHEKKLHFTDSTAFLGYSAFRFCRINQILVYIPVCIVAYVVIVVSTYVHIRSRFQFRIPVLVLCMYTIWQTATPRIRLSPFSNRVVDQFHFAPTFTQANMVCTTSICRACNSHIAYLVVQFVISNLVSVQQLK